MTGEYVWDPGEANPKQKLFFASRKLYTAYGGAKGGGKTWAVRTRPCSAPITTPASASSSSAAPTPSSSRTT